MKERQEERLHPPLKGALGVAPLFGFLFSERARKEQSLLVLFEKNKKRPLIMRGLREVSNHLLYIESTLSFPRTPEIKISNTFGHVWVLL